MTKLQLLSLIVLIPTTGITQDQFVGSYFFENVATGELLDVRNNVQEPGTQVWPNRLNYSTAQIFDIFPAYAPNFGDEVVYNFRSRTENPQLFVSVQQSDPVVSVDPEDNKENTNTERPPFDNEAFEMANDEFQENNSTGILNGWDLTIEKQIYYWLSNRFRISDNTQPRQIWRLILVEGTNDTYYVQSAQFTDRYVLQIYGNDENRSVALAKYNGVAAQQWKIRSTRPERASNVSVSQLEWTASKVKGKVSWTANNAASELSKVEIFMYTPDSFDEENGYIKGTVSVAPGTTSYDFEFPFNPAEASIDHCFRVRNYTNWEYDNSSSNQYSECVEPDYTEPTPLGVCKINLYNCDIDKRVVRIWLADMTEDLGEWESMGTINSQYGTDGCPTNSSTPMAIPLSSDHIFKIVAIPSNCGSLNPNETPGSCYVGEYLVQGADDTGGQTYVISIAGGTNFVSGCQ